MNYAEIKENKIINIFCGPENPDPEKFTTIPERHPFRFRDDIRFFDIQKNKKGDITAAVKLTSAQAEAAGLVTAQENQIIVWSGGKYNAVDDYTGRKYWDKNTGQLVRMKLGQKPTDNMTDIEKEDPASEWQNGEWVIPNEVKSERILAERDRLLLSLLPRVIAEFNFKDKTVRDYRDALLAVTDQAGFPDTVEWPEAPK
jgi:hypothetical protein